MSNERESKRVLPATSPAEVETWVGLGSSVVAAAAGEDEDKLVTLRPGSFEEYIGQQQVKEALLISCGAARKRGDAMDHALLYGPPGLGKTTLAKLIATQLNVGFKATSGPVIERPGDLAAILTSLQPRDVLFIDEIHRLPRITEEVLYPAMEDFALDILIGQGPTARSLRIDLKPFTLVGATTRTGLLTSPLRDRFGLVHRLNYYSPEELQQIVKRSAQILKLEVSSEVALEIGRRSRGTPRIANRLLRRIRDFAEERAQGRVTTEIVRQALELLGVDQHGLDVVDRLYLGAILEKFNGGPVGVATIATSIGEEVDTVEDMIEPYLMREGLIVRTPRGREVSERGWQYAEKCGIPVKGQRPHRSGSENLELF